MWQNLDHLVGRLPDVRSVGGSQMLDDDPVVELNESHALKGQHTELKNLVAAFLGVASPVSQFLLDRRMCQ